MFTRKTLSIYVPVGFKAAFDNVDINDEENAEDFVNFNEVFFSAFVRIPVTDTRYKAGTSLFFNSRFSRYSGNSTFYSKLDNDDLKDPFNIVRATAGLEIGGVARIAANFGLFKKGAFRDLHTTTIGIQVDPTLLTKR